MNNTIPAWFQAPEYNNPDKQAVVIGGGLAGAQIAWHLAECDWQITLIEQYSHLAQEASGNAAGVISPKMTAQISLGEDFYRRCFQYTLQQLAQLQENNKPLIWQQCGVLQLNHNTREYKRCEALNKRQFSSDFLRCLNATQASAIAGIPLSMGGSYFPQGAWIDPRSFVASLAQHKNIQIQYQQTALHIIREQSTWLVQDAKDHILASTQTLILANGKAIQQFPATADLPFIPVLGQTSTATSSISSQKLRIVLGHEGYLTPSIQGQHVFGATFERDNLDCHLNPAADRSNYQQLQRHLPDFSQTLGTINSSHAAIRMITPDRFPYIGALADTEYYQQHYADIGQGKHWKNYPPAQYQQGLFIFAGHASRGITTTGLCAKYLSALITQQSFADFSSALQQAVHPARFMIRQLKRQGTVT